MLLSKRKTFRGSLLFVLLYAIILGSNAYMKSVRIEEIPFELSGDKKDLKGSFTRGIFALEKLDQRRDFFHLFNVQYIVCFFAAKGKWPFIPSIMQTKVETVSRSVFSQSDNFIENYCRGWMAVNKFHRPNFDSVPTAAPQPINTDVETFKPNHPTTPCSCVAKSVEATAPIVYFDRNYIGNVSSETILNTIEFLESFLPPPTKKSRKKTRVRNNG